MTKGIYGLYKATSVLMCGGPGFIKQTGLTGVETKPERTGEGEENKVPRSLFCHVQGSDLLVIYIFSVMAAANSFDGKGNEISASLKRHYLFVSKDFISMS